LVERQQHGAVRGAHLAVAPRRKALGEELIPALRCLCQQKAEVVAVDWAHAANWLRMLSNSRSNDWYWDSNSSSGMPGAWNIVKLKALVSSGRATTRVE